MKLWPDPDKPLGANNFVYTPDQNSARRQLRRSYRSSVRRATTSSSPAIRTTTRGRSSGFAAAGRRHHAGWPRQLDVPGHLEAKAAGDPSQLRSCLFAKAHDGDQRRVLSLRRRDEPRTTASSRLSRWASRASTSTTDSSGLSRIIVAAFVELGDAGFIPLVIANDLVQGPLGLTYVSGGNTLKEEWISKAGRCSRRRAQPRAVPSRSTGTSRATGARPERVIRLRRFCWVCSSSTEQIENMLVQAVLPDEGSRDLRPVRPPRGRLAHDQCGPPLGPLHGVHREGQPDREPRHGRRQDHRGGRAWRDACSQRRERPEQLLAAFRLGGHDRPPNGPPRRLGVSYMPLQLAGGAFRNPPFISLLNISPPSFAPQNRLSDGLPQPVAIRPTTPTGNLAAIAFDITVPIRPPVQHRAAARTAGQRGRADRLRRDSRA